jgi:hypothetical protein
MDLTAKRPRKRIVAFDRERFKTIVHYVCWVCEDPRVLGPIKLNWILWYADRNVHLLQGQPLAGATYVKRPYGPLAKALTPVLGELEKERLVAIRPRSHGVALEQYFAIRGPSLSALRPEHVSQLEAAIRHVCFDPKAPVLNQQAHDRVWRVARVGETLPYYTVLSGAAGDLLEADLDWAIRELRQHRFDTDWKEMEELRELNFRIEDACKALVWFLTREPSAGIQIPNGRDPAFIYKQRGNRALDVPDISVIYKVDLEEVVLGRFRYTFPDAEDEDESSDIAPLAQPY